jgi:hypothetical protein
VLYFVVMGLQIGEFPHVKRGARMTLPLINKLNPDGPLYKPLLGLAMVVLSPLVLTTVFAIPMILRLPVLPIRILLGMVFKIDVGVLTFEVRSRCIPFVSRFIASFVRD